MLPVLLVLLIILPPTAHYPMLNGEDKGCAHDGSDVDVGDWVMVGCDNCTCTPGKIVCPVPPTCPRNCSYKGISHRHGESFYNSDTCDECECKDGTVTCVFKDCNDACTVNGLHYDKGETFKIDCETCQCLGQDVIRCNKHFCPCFVDNQIIQHGDEITEKSDPRGTIIYKCVDGRITVKEDNRMGGPIILVRAGRGENGEE